MSGSMNRCDLDLLQPGMPCIIEVDDVNRPTGLWWGEVVAVADRGSYHAIEAKITGGRMAFSDGRREYERGPIRSDEQQGVTPHLNYRVYPDTETMRRMFQRVMRLQDDVRVNEGKARRWQEAHAAAIKAAVEAAHDKGVKLGSDNSNSRPATAAK